MNQDVLTYLLIFAIALIVSITLFKIGKKIICLIVLLLAIYCGVQAVLYYLAAGYEMPAIEFVPAETIPVELPESRIKLPSISYEEDPNAFGFGMDGIINK